MTVLMREEMNDADLAWAAADVAMAVVMGQLLRARQTLATGLPLDGCRARDGVVIEPALLREWGAL